MNWKKIILWGGLSGLLIGGSIFAYLWFMPHRDVQATEADAALTAVSFVEEYLADPSASNQKYLADDGDSKILILSGTVQSVDEDIEGNAIIFLASGNEHLPVKCNMVAGATPEATVGSEVKIKGVVRAGPSYDEDLDLYEPASVGECSLIK